MLAPTLALPALWLGGVKPWVVPIFAALVLALLLRRTLRTSTPLRVPAFWSLGLFAAGLTLIQWLPLPTALLDLLAPGLRSQLAELLQGTPADPWPRLSIHPGQTGLEVARLLALTGLFVAAAQLSWRLVTSYVAAIGALVALVGLVHQLLGVQAIYGIYDPRQDIPGLAHQLGSPLLGSFVNPNHQSALLLIGIFAAAATALDLQARSDESSHARERERLADRAFLAWGAGAIQVTALLLSMSRAALVSFMIVAPIALMLGLRERGGHREHDRGRKRRRAAVLAVLVLGLAGMFVLAAVQGATEQLASLRDPEAFRQKFRVAREGLALVELSPILGIGRGTFVDLFPLVDRSPGRLQFTHLETTPVAWIVEWGPLPAAILLIGIAAWAVQSFRADSSATRRIALCGLLALAIQSWADFSLDYLGVAAPALALAGALGAGKPDRAWACRPVRWFALAGSLLAIGLAISSIPASWSARRDRDLALLASEGSLDDAFTQTPCDPLLHLAAARRLADEERWSATLIRARAAARLRPTSVEAHLLAALALARLDRDPEALEQLRAGLRVLPDPIPPELLDYILRALPTPELLLRVAPIEPPAWQILARALVEPAPAHARALAAARAAFDPDDPEPLRLQVLIALRQDNPGLALHHARLLVALRPREAAGHRLRAQARFAFGDPIQSERAIAELEAALAKTRLDDPGSVEELLVRALIHRGDAASLERAERLMQTLLGRKADRPSKQRRQELADQLERARAKPAKPEARERR
ncbi:O-antigen ligase family protein [Nannocystaceae bacterium ST9]